MAEEIEETNSWALKQANVLEKIPFTRVKIFLFCAIVFNTKLNVILQGQAEGQ